MSPTSRSVFAIIDALLLFLALQGLFYAVAFLGLHLSFDTATPAYLTCNLIWTLLSATLAGYTAGRVARRNPIAHGLVLAIPFVLLAAFNLYKGLGSRRTPYVLAINLLVPILCIVGASLYHQRRRYFPGKARLADSGRVAKGPR